MRTGDVIRTRGGDHIRFSRSDPDPRCDQRSENAGHHIGRDAERSIRESAEARLLVRVINLIGGVSEGFDGGRDVTIAARMQAGEEVRLRADVGDHHEADFVGARSIDESASVERDERGAHVVVRVPKLSPQ
jgi:hypothetical protein